MWNYFEISRFKAKLAKGDCPSWASEYWAQYQHRDKHKSLRSARFVVFDTETTGLDTKKDQILSIGAVVVEDLKISVFDSLEIYLQNDTTGNKETVCVHQILKQEVRKGMTQENALKHFFQFAKADILVAHFAEFDRKMLQKLLHHTHHIPLLNPSLDTIQLAKRIDGVATWDNTVRGSDYTLDALCQRYHIHIGIRHHAVGDALATAELLQILLQKAWKRGIRRVGELL